VIVLWLGYQRIISALKAATKSSREKQARQDGILAASDSDGLAESGQLRTQASLVALLRS
jgi:hypothetical protein